MMIVILYAAYLLLCVLLFKALWHSQWPMLDTLCLIMAMAFPIVGLAAAIWWRGHYRPSVNAGQAVIAEHAANRFEPVVNYANLRAQAQQDAQAEALRPALLAKREAGHTNVVVQLQNAQIPAVGRLLEQALDTGHVDTVHYAATTWQKLTNRHQQAIAQAKDAYATQQSAEAGKSLLDAQRALIDAALLDQASAKRAWQQLEDTAAKLTKRFPGVWQFWAALVDAKLHAHRFAEAAQCLDDAAQAGVANAPMQYRRLHLAYATNDWTQVGQRLQNLGAAPLVELNRNERHRINLLRRTLNETG